LFFGKQVSEERSFIMENTNKDNLVNNNSYSKEPLSEDDCLEDVRIVSFKPFELENEKISLNYIKEENKDFFRPLNTQLDKKRKNDKDE
jgi:hypothetical protein